MKPSIKSKLKRNETKALFFSVLAGVAIVSVTWIQNKMFSVEVVPQLVTVNFQDDQDRKVASSGDLNNNKVISEKEMQVEKQISRQLEDPSRIPSSLGRAPSALENLKYVFLDNKYRLVMNDKNQVTEIDYISSLNPEDKPIDFKPSEFLNGNKNLLGLEGFDMKNKSETPSEGQYTFEDAKSKKTKRAIASFDEEGRVRNIKIEDVKP